MQTGKQYYINDYFPPAKLEQRRRNKQMVKTNEEAGTDKKEMELKAGAVWVEGKRYQPKIQPPNAQPLLDMTVDEVQRVVKAAVNNGPAIEKEGNKFIGYTACVENLQEVQDAYLKLRLCTP